MKLNQQAYEQAARLIKAGKVERGSDWKDARPTLNQQEQFLHNHDMQAFSAWYLGIADEAATDTPAGYDFLYGDFEQVHRSALIIAKQRASHYEYTEVEEAIDQLIISIDKKPDAVTEASEDSFPASDPPNWRDRR